MNNGVLSHSEKNSECYSYLQLPLTIMGKMKIGIYCYMICRYITEMFLEYSSINHISFFSKLLTLIGCHGNRKAEFAEKNKTEDHWSCIAHLSAEDMLKSAVIEEKKF